MLPSYLMSMGSMFSAEEIGAMAGGVIPPAPRDYKLPTQFPSLSRAKRICYDLESHDESMSKDLGPGWRRGAYIIGFSIAIGDGKSDVPEYCEYYPLRHKNGPNLDAERVMDWLRDELVFYTGEITGANLLYDAEGSASENVLAPLAKWRDTQWAEALINENAYSYTLDTLSRKYLGHGKDGQGDLKGLYGPDVKTRMREVHPGHMRKYGIGDVAQPLSILNHQEKELRKQKLDELYDLECRLMPMLLYMRRRGQRVDLQAAEELHDKLQQRRKECLAAASKMVPARGFELTTENFGKPSVLCAAFDSLGITYPKTEAGNASIKDKWLDALEHPFGKALASANRYDKALETFVNGYITDYQINGRVHCEFHPLRSVSDDGSSKGTVSGRFSSGNPNLQNIPARDKEIGPLCRGMFIPEEGMDYFSGDYSQIEFRLLVHAAYTLSQVKGKRPWDDEVHARLQTADKARQMYINDPSTDFHNMVVALTGLDRKYAKGINFGIAFTMGVDKLAVSIGQVDEQGRPTQKAHDILAQYHNKVEFVKAVGQAFVKMAKHDGHIATLLGRRSHFDMWEPRYYEKGAQKGKAMQYEEACAAYGGASKIARAMTHKSLNCYTQGGGADLIKTSMVRAWESGILDSDELIISLTVHDELDGSVARNKAGQERMAELKHIMETAIPISLPTTAEFATGANWAATH